MKGRRPALSQRSPRTWPWQLLRVATLAGVLVFLVLAYRTFTARSVDVPRLAEPRKGELDVATAIAVAVDKPLLVRGYVFVSGPTIRLCSGVLGESPPKCVGPFLELDRVDAGSFALEGDGPPGRRWGSTPVAVRGMIVGTRIDVSSVER